MDSLIRNYSFVIIFFLLSTALGLFLIFSLANEEESPNGMTGNREYTLNPDIYSKSVSGKEQYEAILESER